MQETYQEAIKLLRSQTRLAKATTKPDEPRLNIPNNYGMIEWLAQLGHTDPDALNVIHITGTKGKGSTAALTASLLREHFARTGQHAPVGLYTSPHVLTERDRIRVDLAPVSEADFASAFFEVWHTLHAATPGEAPAAAAADDDHDDPHQYRPGYLQLLALLSFHLFRKRRVAVAVYEVHAGGRKDATNIFRRPLACGFARIGADHAALLGPGVDRIAWHKSGIMKPARPAFTVPQDPVPAAVLRDQAAEIGAPLHQVADAEEDPSSAGVRQQRQQRAQRENAALAVALANAALQERGERLSEADVENGIARCRWPGRFQHLHRDRVHWFLDAAHNELSLPVAVDWFCEESRAHADGPCRRVLVFGHASERSTERLVDALLGSASQHDLAFDQVILSSYNRYDIPIPESVAREQLEFWKTRNLQVPIQHAITADVAIEMVKEIQRSSPDTDLQVLITGSAHLVGQSLGALGGEELVMGTY